MTDRRPEAPDPRFGDPRFGDASFDYGGEDFPDPVEVQADAPVPNEAEGEVTDEDEAEAPAEDETVLIDGKAVKRRPVALPSSADTTLAEATPTPPEPTEDDPEPAGPAQPTPAGFRGLTSALRVRRSPPTQFVIAVLLGLLGFFAVVQLRLQADDDTLRSARQSDLIRILDDLNDRTERLNVEIADLEDRRDELRSGSDRSQAALTEAQSRRDILGILAGTEPARGAGITLRITDPQQKVDAAVLLDTLQELRDAGAEAVQINDVRVVASTDFLDAAPGSVRIDGRVASEPYTIKVIGDPDTLDPALRIPGGVFAVLDERGATPTVETRERVVVDATRPPADLDYARLRDPE